MSGLPQHERARSCSTPRLTRMTSSIRSFAEDIGADKSWRTGKWRHTLGITLLLATVFMWTANNFMLSTVFADDTYSRPYFVTYITTAFFILPLVPALIQRWRENPAEFTELREFFKPTWRSSYDALEMDRDEEEDLEDEEDGKALVPKTQTGVPSRQVELDDSAHSGMPLRRHASSATGRSSVATADRLTLLETLRLSLQFCFIWFIANYLTAVCLQYTTVASSTILTSTSSIWTLVFGYFWSVETFTIRKLLAVLASLAGIILISSIDITGNSDADRGTFPDKTTAEIALGDAMAFASAVLYGIYVVLMKKQIGDESRVSMPLFFGLVGFLNVLLLWPGIIVLHFMKVEEFLLPPKGKVLFIIIANATTSLVADFTWAWSMLLTSPLITTVGLSMTIPLSLVGQMVLDGQYATFTYWIGAAVVVLSFLFVNREEVIEEMEGEQEGSAHSVNA